MATRTLDDFKLGLTVLVMLTLFFGTLFFIAGGASWGQTTDTVTVEFTHDMALPTLSPGGDVRCGGQKVGTIAGVEFVEKSVGAQTDAARQTPQLIVAVTAEIDRSVGLRRDCRITAEGPTLGGTGWLIIRDRGTDAKPVDAATPVAGLPPAGFAAVTNALSEMGESLSSELDPANPTGMLAMIKGQLDAERAQSLIGKLHRSLNDVNFVTATLHNQLDAGQRDALLAKLLSAMDDLTTITQGIRRQLDTGVDEAIVSKLHRSLDTLNGAMGDVAGILDENRQPIRETVAHLRATAETLDKRVVGALAAQLDIHNHASLMAKIHQDADLVGQALTEIKMLATEANATMTLNRPSFDRMLLNLKETSEHLKAASKDLRRNPWRLLYQPSDKETREINVFDAARAYAEAAAQLDDASARLEALVTAPGRVVSPSDPDIQAIRQQLTETFEKFSQTEAALWKMLGL